jgi:phage tail sheath gpL-like
MVYYILFKANPTDDVTSLTSGVKVYSARSEIIIEGAAPRETVTLYSITGKQLKTVVSTGERLNIPVDKQGIYLVKIGGKTYKVVV